MRKTLPLIAAMAVGLGCFGPTANAQEQVLHAPDGGTRQRVQSVDIPPMQNAPFSAVVTTEWTRIMPDGSKQTVKNHRTVARDSSGRVFQERRYFNPEGDKQVTRLSELDFEDPNRHEVIVCLPNVLVCTVQKYNMPVSVSLPKVGPLPNGMGELTREDLGRKTIENLDVVGTREVMTINAGAIGNEKAQPVVKEFWYSPHLGINVSTKRFDPRASAIQDFEVGSISVTEPDSKMFEPPAGYRVVRADGQ